MYDYLHLFTHSGIIWVSSWICINFWRTNALSIPFLQVVQNAIPCLFYFLVYSACTPTLDKVSSPFLLVSMLPCCSESWSIHLHKPSGSSTIFLGYDLCSLKFFSLVVSFGFMPIIDVMLFILFTIHLTFSIEFANTFSGSLRSWANMVLSICFANYLLKKGLNKSCIFVLVFFWLFFQCQHCAFQAILSRYF